MKESLKKLATLIPFEKLEHACQQDFYAALELEFLLKLAVMPDAHKGYLLPIGGVALLDGVISPNYVGYDVGCGMCNVMTDIDYVKFFKNMRAGRKVYEEILARIPVGMTWHQSGIDYKPFKSAGGFKDLDKMVETKLNIQLGTLGGGNHFIEIGPNNSNRLGVTIHSGSRKPGWWIGQHYMRLTKKEDMHLPRGFLDANKDLGKAYFEDMNFFLEYALENRRIMMGVVLDVLGISRNFMKNFLINENHNHAVITPEGHYLHRKGATPAEKGTLGVIPGNMSTGTYITEGLGNEDYLKSASHGAGRKLARKAAKNRWSDPESGKGFQKAAQDAMKGIIGPRLNNVRDEVPAAYKDLDQVIAMQEGIVLNVVDRIKPHHEHHPRMIVVKGEEVKDQFRKKKKNRAKWAIEPSKEWDVKPTKGE